MTFFLCSITILYLTAGIFYFGNRIKRYSHLKHTISELGETGSRYEKQAGYGLFLPVGMLLVIIAASVKDNTNVMGLALSLSAGYIIAAFFPCDPGAPSFGSWKQQLHNTGGFIEYAGSVYFIMKAAESGLLLWGIPFKTIGFIMIAGIIIVSAPANPARGLTQRIMELLLFGCLLWQLN